MIVKKDAPLKIKLRTLDQKPIGSPGTTYGDGSPNGYSPGELTEDGDMSQGEILSPNFYSDILKAKGGLESPNLIGRSTQFKLDVKLANVVEELSEFDFK
jgi:hypothetical protein